MTSYNKEPIIKLLVSNNQEDNFLALNIIRGRNLNNWGAFLLELEKLTHGYFYTIKLPIYNSKDTLERQLHLRDKYFYNYTAVLREIWNEKIY